MESYIVQFQDTPSKRALGLMGRRPDDLLGQFFAFIYPFEADRTFQTFFCPPLRLVAFSEEGIKIFDEVVSKGKFVRIPPTRLIIESHPDTPIAALEEDVQKYGVGDWVEFWHRRLTVDAGTNGKFDDDVIHTLFMSMIEGTLRDIRDGINAMGGKYAPRTVGIHRRAQMIDSALYLLSVSDEIPFSLPPTATALANDILKTEKSALINEVRAAAIAGMPWMTEQKEGPCCLCGDLTWYRQVIDDPELPEEVAWRLKRPENYALLCSTCCTSLGRTLDKEQLLIAFSHLTWGVRFIALRRWYLGFKRNNLPGDWDLDDYPLWPKEYGGLTWMNGSGALQHCAPRWNRYPNILPEHQEFRDKIFTERMKSQILKKYFVVLDELYKC